MVRFRIWRHFDYVLLAVVVLLTAYGVLMIYSANLGSPDPRLQNLWRRQATFGTVGVGLIFLLAAFPRDYEWLGDFWWLAYLLAVVLLGVSGERFATFRSAPGWIRSPLQGSVVWLRIPRASLRCALGWY